MKQERQRGGRGAEVAAGRPRFDAEEGREVGDEGEEGLAKAQQSGSHTFTQRPSFTDCKAASVNFCAIHPSSRSG